jgi:hypothetical protein
VSKLQTTDFIEAQAVMVCCVELEKIEKLHRFKLSKALAFSLFVLNVVRARLEEDNPIGIVRQFDHCVIDQIDYFSSPLTVTGAHAVTLTTLVFWLRNRLTHFEGISRGDRSRGGLTIDGRAASGIRGFRVNGAVFGNPADSFDGHTDRRKLTMLVRRVTDEYVSALGYQAEFSSIEKSLREQIRSVEREA